MRRILPFLLIGMVLALDVTFSHHPLHPHPGDSVAVVMTLTGNATNVEYRYYWRGWSSWKKIEDVVGTAQHVFYIPIPPHYNPGTYYIPLEIRYDEGDSSYTEEAVIKIEVFPREGVEVELDGKLVKGTITNLVVRVKAHRRLRNLRVCLTPSMEGCRDVGSSEGNLEIPFTVVATCRGGLMDFNVLLTSEEISEVRHIVKRCASSFPLSVEVNLPKELSQGRHPLTVIVTNNSDLPISGTLEITANVPLSGETTRTFELSGRHFLTQGVVIDVEKDVVLTVKISGDVNGVWRFAASMEKEPRLLAYVKKVEKSEVTLEVSNIGTGEAKNVVVRTGGGVRFIGDLSPGDYDTVDIPLEANTLEVNVEYLYEGNWMREKFTFTVERDRKEGFPWWIPALLLLLIILWVIRRGPRAVRP